jgi:WD40 repeat protein
VALNATDHSLEHTFLSGDFLFHIAFSPDGQLLAAAGTDTETDGPLGNFELWPPKRSILLWRTSDGWLMQTLRSPQREVHRLLFNPDGRTLISAGTDKDYNDIVCLAPMIAHPTRNICQGV